MIKFLIEKKNRNFLRLWLAQLISQFGDRITQMALVGLIAERNPGSALELAKLLAFTILPVFLVQPIAGVWVDRWDRRSTLFICDLVRGVLILLIAVIFIRWQALVPIYFLIFLAFCFSRFYIPAKMSIIPDLVDEKNLLIANSLVSTTGMIAFVLGCALGGFLIEAFGARCGFFIDAATFFICAALLFSIDLKSHLTINKERLRRMRTIVRQAPGSFWSELTGGMKYLVEHKEIRFILWTLFLLLAAAGAIYVVIIVFVQNTFNSLTRDLGILAVFLGAGLFLGALSYGRWGKAFGVTKTIFFCLLTGGLMLISFAIIVHHFANLWMAIVLAFLLGFIIGPIFIASNTIIHIVSDESMRGKVFSAVEVVIHFAFLVSMLLSSILQKYVNEVWILTGVGVLFTLIGAAGYVRFQKDDALAITR